MYREALEESLTAIRLTDEKDNNRMISLWSHYNAALAHYHLGNLSEAEKSALSGIRNDPNHMDSHFMLTVIYYDQRDWARVIEHGSEYLRLNDRFNGSPESFGDVVACSLKENWNVSMLIGFAYAELGRSDSSHQTIEKAVSCAPEPSVALRAAGIYFYNKKDLSKAKNYLLRAGRENPDDETVKNLLKDIREERREGVAEATISCCLIVKNEEAFLRPCLDSVKDYVDEIVIVDTGSEDATIEIARQYTDKVYSHPWEGSFSKARNQVLSYATGGWIFQIDADEELMEGSGPKLRQAVRDAGPADAILVNIISTYSGGTKKARHNFERLFRNNGVIHYEGIVHNRVVAYNNLKASKIELMHYGYDVEEKKACEKFLRTTELLKKQIEESPDDPMPHHYLGVSYLTRGMNEEALRESDIAIHLAEEQKNDHHLYLWARHNAAMSAFRLGRLEEAKQYSLRAIEMFPTHLDSFYALAMIAAERQEWSNVLVYGKKFLHYQEFYEKNHDQAGLILNTTMKEGAAVHLIIGHACHACKDHKKMEKHYAKAADAADEEWQAWWNAGTFHLDRSGDLTRAKQYLERALQLSPEEPSIWYMLAKLSQKSERPEEEETYLEKLYASGSEDLVILNRLSALSIDKGDWDRAREILGRALKTDPSNYPALCSLGRVYRQNQGMDRAIEVLMRAVEIYPDGTDPWVDLGEICLDLNRLQDAKAFFERALALDPGLLKALLYLSEIGIRQNRIVDSVQWCDRILEKLGLDRNRTLHGMEDFALILADIATALRRDRVLFPLALRSVSLLPIPEKEVSLLLKKASGGPPEPANPSFFPNKPA